MSKKVFITLNLIVLLLFTLTAFVLAQGKDLEVKYPEISEDIKTPTGTETSLTDYIRYVFALSIRIAGFIALGVMIYGGIRYLVSGGSAGKMADARKQILGGFLGIVILLSSYLILRTINPAIVSTSLTKEATADCSKCSFNQDTGEIDDCDEHEKWRDFCKLELDHFKSPGVYLIGTSEETERVHLQQSVADLSSLTNAANPDKSIDLNNKVTEIRFGRKNTELSPDPNKEIEEYCAILHEYENFEGPVRVVCRGETDNLSGSPTYSGDTGNLEDVSSITIFQLDPEASGTVAIYPLQDFNGNPIDVQNFSPLELPEQSFMTPVPLTGQQIYSVQIEGSFLVLLCGEDFYSEGNIACQLFTSSIYDIRETNMGMCDVTTIHDEEGLYFLYHSCVGSESIDGSFAIFKIKPIGYVQ